MMRFRLFFEGADRESQRQYFDALSKWADTASTNQQYLFSHQFYTDLTGWIDRFHDAKFTHGTKGLPTAVWADLRDINQQRVSQTDPNQREYRAHLAGRLKSMAAKAYRASFLQSPTVPFTAHYLDV